MEPQDAGRYHFAVEAVHAMAYFVPETYQYLKDAGLHGGMMPYFASRSAPMGAVGSEVVTATFYNFHPRLVAESIPLAWTLLEPSRIVEVKFKAIADAFARILGDGTSAPDIAEAVGLAKIAIEACSPEGRPLFAAFAGLGWPGDPITDLWHAIGLLREHRGDGHVAALVRSGLGGIEALVTHSATGTGFTNQAAQWTRGWSEQEWSTAEAGLFDRGLLDQGGALTADGLAMRDRIESETDEAAVAPWKHLGKEKADRLTDITRGLARAIIGSGTIPDGVFRDLERYTR